MSPPTGAGHWSLVDLRGREIAFDALLDEFESARSAGARVVVVAVDGSTTVADASPESLLLLERLPLPTVAAITGALSRATTDLALACDIRVCSAGATLRPPVGTRRILRLIGPAASVDLLRRGSRVDAPGAFAAGLVTQVMPEGEDVVAAALALARTIAARGPIATRLAKEAIWRGLEMPFDQALRFETDLTLLLQTTKDRAEGVRAFLDKRPPKFEGD